MRKNIFQILQEKFDVEQELERINRLFTSKLVHSIQYDAVFTAEEFVEKFVFVNWKQRHSCTNLFEMKQDLAIERRVETSNFISISDSQVMNYIEYVENILALNYVYIKTHEKSFCYAKEYKILRENLNSLEDHLNLEIKYFQEEEMVLLVEKNAAATAVAEIMPDNDLSMKVIQYNHHLLKGDLKQKRNIILALADELEPKRKRLKELNDQFENDLFYVLNNVNLRHNNITPGNGYYHECIANLSEEDLEAWYDDVYQMELLAFLLMDHQPRKKMVKELKQALGGKKNDQ